MDLKEWRLVFPPQLLHHLLAQLVLKFHKVQRTSLVSLVSNFTSRSANKQVISQKRKFFTDVILLVSATPVAQVASRPTSFMGLGVPLRSSGSKSEIRITILAVAAAIILPGSLLLI